MSMSKAFENAKATFIKVTCFFVVSQVLAGKSLMDKAWQTEAIHSLMGFAAYDLLVSQFIDPKMLGAEYAGAVQDVTKFTTMLVVVRLLSGKPFDGKWMMSTGAMMAGFIAYNLVVKKMISTGQLKGDMKQIADDWLQWGTMLIVSKLVSGGNPMDMNFLKQGVNEIVGLNIGSKLDGV